MNRCLILLGVLVLAGCGGGVNPDPSIPPSWSDEPIWSEEPSWSDEPIWSEEPGWSEAPVVGAVMEELVGLPVDDPLVGQIMVANGCHSWSGLYVPGGLIPGNGIDCQSGGVSLSIDMGLNVSDVSMYDADPSIGFSQFTGSLPLGLAWGDSRAQVMATLEQRFGSPVRQNEPMGEIVNWWSADFAVSGERYGGLRVQFAGNTELLSEMTLSRDAPISF